MQRAATAPAGSLTWKGRVSAPSRNWRSLAAGASGCASGTLQRGRTVGATLSGEAGRAAVLPRFEFTGGWLRSLTLPRPQRSPPPRPRCLQSRHGDMSHQAADQGLWAAKRSAGGTSAPAASCSPRPAAKTRSSSSSAALARLMIAGVCFEAGTDPMSNGAPQGLHLGVCRPNAYCLYWNSTLPFEWRPAWPNRVIPRSIRFRLASFYPGHLCVIHRRSASQEAGRQ